MLLGMRGKRSVDREKLYKVICYMKSIVPLIVCDFIKFVPATLFKEPPKKLPVRYSETAFYDSLPEYMMKYLHDNMEVYNLISNKGTLQVELDKPLHKGTGLCICFPRCEGRSAEIVRFTRIDNVSENKMDGKLGFRIYVPDSISDEEFSSWLIQSKNAAAKSFVDETLLEFTLANEFNCFYLTKSELKKDLLNMVIGEKSTMQEDIANLAMKIDLPVFEKIDLKSIVSIRNNYGDSFLNFRAELGNRLVKLRGEKDSLVLKQKLDEISQELSETNVQRLRSEIKILIQSLRLDTALVAGSLMANYIVSGNDPVAGIATAATFTTSTLKIIKDSVKPMLDIRQNPSYFLWKIKKKSEKND